MDECGRIHQPTMPMLSRLDRLDSLMKFLERKYDLSKWCDDAIWALENRCRPLDLALKEVYTKGSVLDRIDSLENRLLQLSLDMEASSAASSSTIQTYESLGQRHGSESQQGGLLSFHSSFEGEGLTYRKENQRHLHEFHLHMPDFQGDYKQEKVKVKVKRYTKLKHLLSKGGDKKDACKTDKRRSRKSLCNRLLGC